MTVETNSLNKEDEEEDGLEFLQTRVKRNGCPQEEEDSDGFVSAPIDALGPPGRWIRHRLLESILYGTPVLVAIQHLRTRRISRYMKISSILGTEEAYAVLCCFLIWIVDMRLGRLCSIAMALGFYFANAIKNCLCLPRPPSPPVKPLEDAYYTWGLPSHHSVLAVVCPWYIWFYCLLHYNLEFTTFVCLFTLISLWSSSVLICRIYNGVHSPADVVTGSLIGLIIVAVMNRFDNIMDLSSYMNEQGASLLVPVLGAFMLFLHPFNEVGLAAFKETTSMMSASIGFVLARAASHGRSPPLRNVMEMYKYGESSLFTTIYVAVARVFIGIVLVILSKVVLKEVTQALFGLILRMLDIKYYTKSKTSVFYTGYSSNYRLPPIYKDKKKDDDNEEDGKEGESRLKNLLQQKEPLNISHANATIYHTHCNSIVPDIQFECHTCFAKLEEYLLVLTVAFHRKSGVI